MDGSIDGCMDASIHVCLSCGYVYHLCGCMYDVDRIITCFSMIFYVSTYLVYSPLLNTHDVSTHLETDAWGHVCAPSKKYIDGTVPR